ncbi:hypothetical protein [Burkholderia sp. Bp8998]|uniref:hypothetical protein n=1 Tax=Burkholderia sp. Bp8998 TaxID=2184557 RepID=UPI00163A07ED|nr:hypothetical protein [Burkholderia sp. Bp8998]
MANTQACTLRSPVEPGHDGHRRFVMPLTGACSMLSFIFRIRFTRNPIRDVHISGPYCSARAEEVMPHQRPGARAGCPTTQQ